MNTKKSKSFKDNELLELAKQGFAIRPLRKLPQGTFFQLKPNGTIYIRGHYERSLKQYCCICSEDSIKSLFFPGDKLVAL